jgi:hypothetical protein
MNASDLSSFRKGAIFNTHNSASSIAVMGEASRFFGFFTMGSPGKKRAFAAKKCGALFSFCLLGRNSSKAILANLLPRFRRADVAAKFLKQVAMSFLQMFCLRKAFKVIGAIISLVSVYMVNVFVWGKTLKPTCRYNTVHKPLSSETQIPAIVVCGCIRLQLSDNFSAKRDCVKMVKESILDSFYRDVNHVVPRLVVAESSF